MKRFGYGIAGGLAFFTPFLALLMALDAGKREATLHSNILCFAAVISGMFFPAILIMILIEKRMDRIEKLLEQKNNKKIT